MIDTKQVKELRDKTGISIMQCRKALEQSEGDMKKAEIILQKESRSFAEKKADRTLSAGTVASYIHNTGEVGAMVLLLCETDFVSKNKEFKDLAYNLAMQVVASDPKYLFTEDVSEEVRKETREALVKEVEGKPEHLREKILDEKVKAFFSEKTLLEQPFIKDPTLKVRELIESAIQKFGEKISISKFARYSVS